MKLKIPAMFVLVSCMLAASAFPAEDDAPDTVEGEIKISAKPEKIWEILTNSKKMAKVMGYKWVSGSEVTENPGDSAVMEAYEQATAYTLKVTEPGKELEFSLVPDDASYVHGRTWIITPVDKYTTDVRVIDTYTLRDVSDESAQEMISDWESHLERLRSVAER